MDSWRLARVAAIASLNDAFRAEMPLTSEGLFRFSPGLLAQLAPLSAFDYFKQRAELIQLVADHDFGGAVQDAKRDFALFNWRGQTCCWKIDYLDPSLSGRSIDPTNPEVTTRLLTIMLFEEF